jgi:hypothetical protein
MTVHKTGTKPTLKTVYFDVSGLRLVCACEPKEGHTTKRFHITITLQKTTPAAEQEYFDIHHMDTKHYLTAGTHQLKIHPQGWSN